MRVLVTGSDGSLAQTVLPMLEDRGHTPVPFDLPDLDILHLEDLYCMADRADACIHLAGMKYADRGELEPLETVRVNVQGTANVLQAFGPNTVVASTCKAADPETVYGSTKLIAERIALEAGARVVRYVNVIGSRGSVSEIWAGVPQNEPIPVCTAIRLFITAEEAARLTVDALDWPSGRYAPKDPCRHTMMRLARRLYPNRQTISMPLRRGDRREERLLAACEKAYPWTDETVRIIGQHDPDTEPVEAPQALQCA